jgi:DNA polymerase-3 subunit beta
MKGAMSLVQKAIASKNSLPILDCVKLTQNVSGDLDITGGDQGTMMTVTVPMMEVENFHPICVESALLSEILGAVGKQTARFEVDGTSAIIVYSTGHFNFAVQNADDYPQVEENIEAVDSFTMQADELAKAIAMCRVFAGNDELRPIMTSVCMDMSGEHLVLAATDGHRLVRKGFPNIKTNKSIQGVVSVKTAALLSAYQRPVEMTVRVNERKTAFIAEGFRLVSISVEGNYPRYNSVIPQSNPYKVEVSRSALATALKRAMVAGNKATALVKLGLTTFMGGEGQMSVEARNLDFARSGQDVISCTHNCTSGMNIGFKGTFLAEILATHTTDKVSIELTDPSRAAVVRDIDGDPDLLTLIMPMMLQD